MITCMLLYSYNSSSLLFQKLQKIHWDMGFNGKVPIFAVKVGVDASNGCETFVCKLAYIILFVFKPY